MSDFDSSRFDDGASYLMSDDSFKQYADGAKSLGRPDNDNGNLFCAPSDEIDAAIANSNGDIHELEAQLGLDKGTLGDGPIHRVDINNPSEHNVRMAMLHGRGKGVCHMRERFLAVRIWTQKRVPFVTSGHQLLQTPIDEAAIYIKNAVKELKGQYICFSNVHTTVMAHDNPDYRAIQNGSAYTFPDGSPIARQQKRLGYMNAERVSGPDFMNAMFRGTMDGKISHYFYGSTEETIEKLRKGLEKNYPGIYIKGMYSPPFRDLTPEEDAQTVQMLNDSGADIIWIGLGAPKQEKWMAAHKDKVNALMIGVGAGSNFYAGTVKRAPKWVQKAGMEWLYRLLQDPKRLWKRYFVTNIKYIWYIISGIF